MYQRDRGIATRLEFWTKMFVFTSVLEWLENQRPGPHLYSLAFTTNGHIPRFKVPLLVPKPVFCQ